MLWSGVWRYAHKTTPPLKEFHTRNSSNSREWNFSLMWNSNGSRKLIVITKLGLLTCLYLSMAVSDSSARRDVGDNKDRSNVRMKPINTRVGQSRPQLVLDPEGVGNLGLCSFKCCCMPVLLVIASDFKYMRVGPDHIRSRPAML